MTSWRDFKPVKWQLWCAGQQHFSHEAMPRALQDFSPCSDDVVLERIKWGDAGVRCRGFSTWHFYFRFSHHLLRAWREICPSLGRGSPWARWLWKLSSSCEPFQQKLCITLLVTSAGSCSWVALCAQANCRKGKAAESQKHLGWKRPFNIFKSKNVHATFFPRKEGGGVMQRDPPPHGAASRGTAGNGWTHFGVCNYVKHLAITKQNKIFQVRPGPEINVTGSSIHLLFF